jgi:hypothetical protein
MLTHARAAAHARENEQRTSRCCCAAHSCIVQRARSLSSPDQRYLSLELIKVNCPPLPPAPLLRFDAKEKGIQKLTDKLEKVCDEMKQLNSDGADHIAASTDK